MHVSQQYPEQLRTLLNDAGLDVAHDFALNERMRELFPFETFGRSAARGLLIGNSRALWPRFVSWYTTQSEPPDDPLDHYVCQSVTHALQAAGAPRSQCYFSPVMNYALGEGRHGPVPIQKVAALSGLAALSPVHLNVHPAFGPWFSLRAVVCLDAPPSAAPAPQSEPCESCAKPCLVPFRAALSHSHASNRKTSIRQDWRSWLAIRQACPVGLAHEFGSEQSEYHYLHSAELLHRYSSPEMLLPEGSSNK